MAVWVQVPLAVLKGQKEECLQVYHLRGIFSSPMGWEF